MRPWAVAGSTRPTQYLKTLGTSLTVIGPSPAAAMDPIGGTRGH